MAADIAKEAQFAHLNKDQLYVKIADYAGDFRVTGWVDDPANKFWTNVRPGRKTLTMPFSFGLGKKYVDDIWNGPGNHSTEWTGKMIMDQGGGVPIDNAYNSAISASYNNLVANLVRPLDSGEQNEEALANFLKSGVNKLYLTAAVENTPFFADIQFFVRASGQTSTFFEARLTNSNLTSDPLVIHV